MDDWFNCIWACDEIGRDGRKAWLIRAIHHMAGVHTVERTENTGRTQDKILSSKTCPQGPSSST